MTITELLSLTDDQILGALQAALEQAQIDEAAAVARVTRLCKAIAALGHTEPAELDDPIRIGRCSACGVETDGTDLCRDGCRVPDPPEPELEPDPPPPEPPAPTKAPAKKAAAPTTIDYEAVAQVAREARGNGESVYAAVGTHFGVPRSTVNNWLARCRALGLLAKTVRDDDDELKPERGQFDCLSCRASGEPATFPDTKALTCHTREMHDRRPLPRELEPL